MVPVPLTTSNWTAEAFRSPNSTSASAAMFCTLNSTHSPPLSRPDAGPTSDAPSAKLGAGGAAMAPTHGVPMFAWPDAKPSPQYIARSATNSSPPAVAVGQGPV